jgi:hypothetical protein
MLPSPFEVPLSDTDTIVVFETTVVVEFVEFVVDELDEFV